MRSRIFASAILVLGSFAAGTIANGDHNGAGARRWAIVQLAEPTLIGSTIVQGPVLITHDEAKMAAGEPCTTVQLFDPARGPFEEVVSFRCIPAARPIVGRFTIRTRPNTQLGFGCVLTDYQFAGDREGHGVPIAVDMH